MKTFLFTNIILFLFLNNLYAQPARETQRQVSISTTTSAPTTTTSPSTVSSGGTQSPKRPNPVKPPTPEEIALYSERKRRKRISKSGIRYSYSGADCKAVAYFDNDLDYETNPSQIIPLDSLATISYSIYEAKSPVRRLGERAVSGYTRGIRTVAGTMVFLVIEDHPLKGLVESQRMSKNFSFDKNSKGHSFRVVDNKKNYISTMIEPFNIGLFYKTEVAIEELEYEDDGKVRATRVHSSGAHLVISGIDIISEGMVTSVNDLVTEITMQFVAQDVFSIERTLFDSGNTSTSEESSE